MRIIKHEPRILAAIQTLNFPLLEQLLTDSILESPIRDMIIENVLIARSHEKNKIDIIRLLLSKGARVDRYYFDMLIDLEDFRVLLAAGAPTFIPYRQCSALHIAYMDSPLLSTDNCNLSKR
jgi:hypothetical protein